MSKLVIASLLLMGMSMTGVAADGGLSENSTWRWVSSQALQSQRSDQNPDTLARPGFTQSHERYTVVGQPDQAR
jgi:hypothetical protein